jgi:WxL interacting protein linking bacterial and host surfaces
VRVRRAASVALTVLVGMSAMLTSAAPSFGSAPPADPDPTQAGMGAFAVQPSGPNGPSGRDFFIYTLKSGQVFGDTVGISNLTDKPATFVIYATDARNTNDGGFALLREEENPTDVGSWVELGATQYTLDPGMRADIPFKITVPSDATPGDHVGAIVAQQVPDDPTEVPKGIGVDVRLRIGARIYLRVDGPVTPSLSIKHFAVDYDTPASPFSSSKAVITYVVTNTGNVRLTPTAQLKLSGLFGWGAKQVEDRQLPELLPGSSLEIAETVLAVKPLGRLTADLTLQAPSDNLTVKSSVQMWTIPSLGVAFFVVLVTAAVTALVLWRRRRKRRSPAAAGSAPA